MRRLLTWLVVSLGIAAVVRRLRRRQEQDTFVSPARDDDPAGELRQKLAESRAEEPGGADPAASVEAPDVDVRRADVHEQGRSTVEEMRGADESP